MRPLNRPMFKMGGPVKEGIMDGIKEPQATFGVGNNAIKDPITGREKHYTFIPAGIGLALRGIASRLPAFLRPAGAGTRTVPKLGPPTAGTPGGTQFSKGFPGPRLPGTAGTGPGTAEVPVSALEKFRSIPFVARDPLLMGLTGPTGSGLGGKVLKGVKGTLSYGLTSPTGLATSALFFPGPQIAKGLFGGDDPEIKKEEIAQSQVGQKGKDTKDPKVETENKFQDDGTKKDTSVERLLKGVVKRARTDAAADTAIKFGQQLRTGEASIKDPSAVLDVASAEFDKVSDIQKKVDLARIENELKKQQIKEQALATDKYIAASKATGMPVSYTARKALGIPTSVNETAAVYDKAQAGFSGTDDGAQVIASDWANLENKFFQGPLGNSEQLKTAKKTEEFQISPESVILKSIEEIDGNDGIYTFGTQIYEYTNGVVKRLR